MLAVLVGVVAPVVCGRATISAQQPAAKAPAVAPGASFPAAAELQQILKTRVNDHPGLGLVVGLLDANGKRTIVTAGTAGENQARPLDGQTVFEIGSITKVFTSALLAEMAQRGDVNLTDPVAKYLPASVRVPARGDRQITLADLATHTSGLPRLPANMNPRDPDNPYADYSVQQMYDFLSSYALTRDIGAQYDYSNLGAGLLGHALARRAGVAYEQILTTRVLAPLGMHATCIVLSPALKARLATGHTAVGFPTANWDLGALAGAGALRSTTDDMLTFLAANMARRTDRLGTALQQMQVSRHDAGAPQPGRPEMSIGLGWHIRKTADGEVIWHNGGTYGFHSFAGFDKKKHIAVVVLYNSGAIIDDIGFHLLDATIPVADVKAPKYQARTEIAVLPDVLARYAGEYQLAPNAAITVTTDNEILCIQLTGQGRVRAYPESETTFFLKVADAQIEFTKDAGGAVTGLVLHQNGRDVAGKRR
jgi:CubicO group peptidase (beta-lactamase class C family)